MDLSEPATDLPSAIYMERRRRKIESIKLAKATPQEIESAIAEAFGTYLAEAAAQEDFGRS
jgi:hypothetical protein